ncbi:MAG: acetolactate synthase small subunit, partial [Clostridia bacterium]|nr:acetolactate synthase small subunit [Clostridia bacterium]
KVKELDADESVRCELMLIKVKNTSETREDIRTAADAFKAETIDYTHDSVIMRIAGDSKRIDAFITLMKEFTILEICRTGIVSLERGSVTISEN